METTVPSRMSSRATMPLIGKDGGGGGRPEPEPDSTRTMVTTGSCVTVRPTELRNVVAVEAPANL
eukprot:3392599-Prymnesium_polylepis.1